MAINCTGRIVVVRSNDGLELRGRLWQSEIMSPLVVALHGVMSHALWLAPIAVALQRYGVSFLAVDRRGSGLNDPQHHEVDVAQLVADLDNWISFAQDISSQIHICAFCWGSNYAIEYISCRVWRPLSLILVVPGIIQTEKLRNASISVLKNAPSSEFPVPIPLEDFTKGAYLRKFLQRDLLCRHTVGRQFLDVQRQMGLLAGARLRKLDLPLLMLLAKRDAVADTAKLLELFDHSRAVPKRVALIDAAHGINFEAPDTVAQICAAWCGDLTSSIRNN